ncbi:hypothetical protein WJX84_008755 [Apatococcus fuscideae]|uniref:Fungal lipase-type domain-containing protein n=1 Tax=Apatococcus fuscideae TaxID=2026836 RepID=A0AAW1SXZ9_9CHLO
MKLALRVSYAANVLAFMILAVEFGLKFKGDGHEWPAYSYQVGLSNLAFSGVLLVGLSGVGVIWLARLLKSRRLGKAWTRRRHRAKLLVEAELVVQLVNLIAFLCPNAKIAADHGCAYNLDTTFIAYMAMVRWTCWNTLFLLICIHAHNINPWHKAVATWLPGKSLALDDHLSPAALVVDGSWLLHWPKLLIWLFMESVIITAGVLAICHEKVPFPVSGYASQEAICTNETVWECQLSAPTQTVLGIVAGCGFLWFALWLYLIYQGKASLYGRPYVEYKLANLIIRLQERGRWTFIVFFSLSLILLWFGRNYACTSLIFAWQGLLPMQVLATLNIGAWAYLMMPLTSTEELPSTQVPLQEFAWTLREHDARRRGTQSGTGPNAGCRNPPLFCMEKAFAGLYWSGLAYDSHEAEDMPAKLGWGYELLGLSGHELLWEHKLDTKVLIGWGPGGVTVAFRGTASLRNALSDLQAWRTHHHAHQHLAAGARSSWMGQVVHTGFLRCWLQDSLNKRVVDRTLALAADWHQEHPHVRVPILVTGGGGEAALGELAAFDIAQAGREARMDMDLACYNFGAPRVGNHAFARDFLAAVPNTWNIINDQVLHTYLC